MQFGVIVISNYKYNCNENYFSIIDTEDRAYWLGFIYADGNTHKKETALRIELNVRDSEHLYSFLKCLGSTHKVNYKHIGAHEYIGIDIARKNLVKDLIDKGCVPNKTFKLIFPSEDILPLNLQCHFIRGYFDGDGCISTRMRLKKENMKHYLACVVKFIGTYDMMENISRIIPIDNLKIKEVEKSKGIYQLEVYSRNKIITLMDYLYEDSHFYFSRKYDKYIHDIKFYKIP